MVNKIWEHFFPSSAAFTSMFFMFFFFSNIYSILIIILHKKKEDSKASEQSLFGSMTALIFALEIWLKCSCQHILSYQTLYWCFTLLNGFWILLSVYWSGECCLAQNSLAQEVTTVSLVVYYSSYLQKLKAVIQDASYPHTSKNSSAILLSPPSPHTLSCNKIPVWL